MKWLSVPEYNYFYPKKYVPAPIFYYVLSKKYCFELHMPFLT